MCKEPSQVPGDKMNKTSGVAGPENSEASGSSAAWEGTGAGLLGC